MTKKRRGNFPYEDASLAVMRGRDALQAAREYLNEPSGLDRQVDWSHLLDAVQNALDDLDLADGEVKPLTHEDATPSAVLGIFKRADKAADDVSTLTRADDDVVRLRHLIEDFRTAWHGAARDPRDGPRNL